MPLGVRQAGAEIQAWDIHYLLAPQMLREAGLLSCDWGSAGSAVVRFRENVWQIPRLEQRR